jgi:hypothetical protein
MATQFTLIKRTTTPNGREVTLTYTADVDDEANHVYLMGECVEAVSLFQGEDIGHHYGFTWPEEQQHSIGKGPVDSLTVKV